MNTAVFTDHTGSKGYHMVYVIRDRKVKSLMKTVNHLTNNRFFRYGLIWRGKVKTGNPATWILHASYPWKGSYTDGSDGRQIPLDSPGSISYMKFTGRPDSVIEEGDKLLLEMKSTFDRVEDGELSDSYFTLFRDGERVRNPEEVKQEMEQL